MIVKNTTTQNKKKQNRLHNEHKQDPINPPTIVVKNPKKIVYVFINEDKAYFGIDIVNKDLSKREYKIFIHPASLKGSVASCLIRFAGYKKNLE